MKETLAAIRGELFGRFEVRKTRAQKEAFARWACDYARLYGYAARAEHSGKWLLTRNLVFGDLKRAKTLITAHYDTCACLPFGNVYTPACWPVILLTQLALPAAAYAALCIWLGLPAGSLISAALVALMLFGPANPHTANDNTSGVAFVMLALHAFAGREDVAFVLFDNEEAGLLGSSAFVKAHPALSRRALVLNFDCISDGDTILLAGSKSVMRSTQGKRLAKVLEEIAPQYGKTGRSGEAPRILYPSDQLMFWRGAAFAALKGRRILYMNRIHSPGDTVFDDVNLLCLIKVMQEAFAKEN